MADSKPGEHQASSTTPKTDPGPHNDADNIASKDATGKESTKTVPVAQAVASVTTSRTLLEHATDPDFGRDHPVGPGEVDVKSAKKIEGRDTVLTSAGELDKETVISGRVAGTGVVHVHSLGPKLDEDAESPEAKKGVRE